MVCTMLVLLNNFIRKRTITKSTDERSDFSNGQALLNRTVKQGSIYCLEVVILQRFLTSGACVPRGTERDEKGCGKSLCWLFCALFRVDVLCSP